MTNKRWIAVGMAVVVFVVSFIIPATAKVFMGKNEKQATNILKNILDESQNTTVIEDGSLGSRIAVLDVKGPIMDQEI